MGCFWLGRVARVLAVMILFHAAALPPPAWGQRGERVVQRNLAELVDEAATILRGRVLSVRLEPHPEFTNLQTIVVVLQPLELLKGESGAEFTFRQFIPDPRDQQTRLGYKPGQEVVLMMIQPSRYGLSSPAGLEQGRFRMVLDVLGNRNVVNGFNNLGLFRNITRTAPKLGEHVGERARQALSAHHGGPLAYAEFCELVRAVTAGDR